MTQQQARRPLYLETLESRTVLSTAVALTAGNELLLFDTATPGQITAMRRITGLAEGEQVLGIDFRPATGQLYGISSANRVVTIDAATGAATTAGTPFATPLVGTRFGIDFNPTVDRIRLVSDAEQNLRLHPETGQVVGVDLPLQFSHADPFVFTDPNVVSVAYLNNFPTATDTLLFGIDSNLDTIVLQAPPNNGTLNTVGFLGLDTNSLVGFDVITNPDNMAYGLFSDGSGHQLYRIDIFESQLTLIGTLNTDRTVIDLALDLTAPAGAPAGGASNFGADFVVGLMQDQQPSVLDQAEQELADAVAFNELPAFASSTSDAAATIPAVAGRLTETAVDSLFALRLTLDESLQG